MDNNFVDACTGEGPPKRKRGAQPGNTNALKHGLYARGDIQGEHIGLKDSSGLESEIDLLRLAILRLFTQTRAESVKTLAADLTALARASASLAHRIASDHRQLGQDDEIVDALYQALSHINQELFSS